MATVLLLAGGTSSEREVSLKSGTAVMQALEAHGHVVTAMDPANDIADNVFANYDVIFPALHGTGGEDGKLQHRLEALGHHNYVGSDAAVSELCFDKWRYKQLLHDNHLVTPEAAMVTAEELADHPLLQAPFVLKPYNGGSSVDTFIIRDAAKADLAAMTAACARYGTMLLEELIEGIEITVGILGNTALPVIEIIPPADAEFDYENKYNGATQELCPPRNVSASAQTQAQELALHIHNLAECRDMSRTDIIINPAGKLYVLETNTIPGMTNQSLLPKAAATAGVPMVELCDSLVRAAAQRA